MSRIGDPTHFSPPLFAKRDRDYPKYMRSVFFAVFFSTVVLASCDRPPVPKQLPPDHNALVNSNVKQDQMASSPRAAEAPYELQFIDTMIAHDETAIDAAQLVATRAEHKELKLLAKSIIAARRQEISELRNLREGWFRNANPAINLELPGMRVGSQAVDLEKLDSLKENQFDLEFVRQMVPLDQGSLTLAKDLLSKDVRAELKPLAQSVIEEQEAEIEQMQGWQTQWAK